jgi:flagellar basal-body rod protein FlgF
VPAGAEVSIGHDGTISAKAGNQPANTIGRLKMVTPTAEDPLKRGDDGLFRTTSGDPCPTTRGAAAVGALEGSNVNPSKPWSA